MTQLRVPLGPAAEFQHRVADMAADLPAREALVKASAELISQLAPGILGNSQCSGIIDLDYPNELVDPAVCRVSISLEIHYPPACDICGASLGGTHDIFAHQEHHIALKKEIRASKALETVAGDAE